VQRGVPESVNPGEDVSDEELDMTDRRLSMCAIVLWLVAVPVAADDVPVDSERWIIEAQEHRFEDRGGKPSLVMRGGEAWVEGSDLGDGVIEFDISFDGDRTFVGAVWRKQDPGNYEEFYLRPHQSGKPDANQYTPIFNGNAGWQLYHGEGYSAPSTYPFGEWIHVRIAISGTRAEVYIDDMETPAVFIPELKRDVASGPVGLMAGSQGQAWFTGFRFEPGPVTLKGTRKTPAPAPAGTVLSWAVSSAFDSAVVRDLDRLQDWDGLKTLEWTKLATEPTGLANLARVQGVARGANTVFARVTLISDSDQIKKLSFGFSDAVKVYFDGRAVFSGVDLYRSRDYRYLGTIGYHDAVYLPLKKGENVVWFAVAESFGGWGLQARLDDPSGVRIAP
jgi:hypothetical protein